MLITKAFEDIQPRKVNWKPSKRSSVVISDTKEKELANIKSVINQTVENPLEKKKKLEKLYFDFNEVNWRFPNPEHLDSWKIWLGRSANNNDWVLVYFTKNVHNVGKVLTDVDDQNGYEIWYLGTCETLGNYFRSSPEPEVAIVNKPHNKAWQIITN